MKKAIISISEDAKQYISLCCESKYLMKVVITNKGCSGQKYSYELIDRFNIKKFDEVIVWDTGGIVIDAASVMYLIGSRLDLKKNMLEKYLIWENPQAINHCGCGESFSIRKNHNETD